MVKNFAQIASPMFNLLRNDVPFNFGKEQYESFEALKKAITSDAVMVHPNLAKPFILYTDSSLTGFGAVLAQEVDGVERAIAYASRVLKPTERKYAITQLECTAIYWAIRHYK
jgi:hypothetical protein